MFARYMTLGAVLLMMFWWPSQATGKSQFSYSASTGIIQQLDDDKRVIREEPITPKTKSCIAQCDGRVYCHSSCVQQQMNEMEAKGEKGQKTPKK